MSERIGKDLNKTQKTGPRGRCIHIHINKHLQEANQENHYSAPLQKMKLPELY